MTWFGTIFGYSAAEPVQETETKDLQKENQGAPNKIDIDSLQKGEVNFAKEGIEVLPLKDYQVHLATEVAENDDFSSSDPIDLILDEDKTLNDTILLKQNLNKKRTLVKKQNNQTGSNGKGLLGRGRIQRGS